jgi:hypothetical protein
VYPLKTSPTTSLTDSCAPNPSFPRSLDGRPSCARDADSSTSSPPFVVVVVVARAPPSSLDMTTTSRTFAIEPSPRSPRARSQRARFYVGSLGRWRHRRPSVHRSAHDAAVRCETVAIDDDDDEDDRSYGLVHV